MKNSGIFGKKEKKSSMSSFKEMSKETANKVLGGTDAPAPPLDITPTAQINTSRSNIKN
jgi:hypothetical protein